MLFELFDGKPCHSVCICWESINNSVSLFHTQFVLGLFFFFSSFSLIVFIKFFLIQKSKSSTNLNHKEWKQEGATIDYSTTISDSWAKSMSRVIYLGTIFLGRSFPWGHFFPRGNYVDDKSSDRQFSSGAISRGISSGSNYLWRNCPEQ